MLSVASSEVILVPGCDNARFPTCFDNASTTELDSQVTTRVLNKLKFCPSDRVCDFNWLFFFNYEERAEYFHVFKNYIIFCLNQHDLEQIIKAFSSHFISWE